MIDIRKLKELVRLMVTNELTELDLRDSEEQVTLRRHTSMPAAPMQTQPPASVAGPVVAGTSSGSQSGGRDSAGAADQEELVEIISPMVGTFYAAANPDSEAFVRVGSTVSEDSPVCIIEAMKIFNEIKAGCSGAIHKILVNNGESVEFGQVLFQVKPD